MIRETLKNVVTKALMWEARILLKRKKPFIIGITGKFDRQPEVERKLLARWAED